MSARPDLLPLSSGVGAARPPLHRRERLERLGPQALEDGELLALAAGIPLAVARHALDLSGGPAGLSRSGLVELTALPGMSRGRAAAAIAAVELGRRAAAAPAEPGWRVRTPADVGARLMPAMRGLEREELRTLLLNTKNVVLTEVSSDA